jgi:hypothetical protein
LLSSHRVIVFADLGMMPGWSDKDLVEGLEAGARMIIVSPDLLPTALATFQRLILTAPSP